MDLGTLLLARVDVRHDTLGISYTVNVFVEKGSVGERTSNWPLETCGP